jgi:predicted extracellular nuclease
MHHRLFASVTIGLLTAACGFTPTETTETSATDTDAASTGGTDATGSTGGPTTDTPTSTTDMTSVGPDPTSTTDMSGPTTDEPSTGGSTGGGDDVTIYQIQGGEIAEGSIVTVKDVVVSSSVHPTEGIVFVQEPDGGEMSGISLYLFDEVVMAFDAKPGMRVDLTGEYTEFFGASQIKITDPAGITIVDDQGEPPAPAVVPAADIATGGAKAEAWEGVLVQVDNVTVANPNADIGEFTVDGDLRISDFYLFPQMLSPKVIMGQKFISIAGPLHFSFDNFKVVPRTLADLVGEDLPVNETSIFDIQTDKVVVGAPVVVKGAIVTSPLTFKKDGFFVQDPMGGEFSGIYVYVGMNMVSVQPGDIVDVEGTYDEFFDFSQIKVTDPAKVMVTGNGPVPAPVVVAAADVAAGGPKQEAFESVLVTVEGVQVAAVNDMFGEYELTDGLFVDDLFFAKADWVLPKVGDTFMSLTGPLAFSFMEAKLSPRTGADIVK